MLTDMCGDVERQGGTVCGGLEYEAVDTPQSLIIGDFYGLRVMTRPVQSVGVTRVARHQKNGEITEYNTPIALQFRQIMF